LHRGWKKSNPPLLIFPEFFEVGKYFFFIFQPLKIKEIRKNRNRPGMTPNSVGSHRKIWLILLD